MIGHTISHYKILEKLPTSLLKSRTPSGQVGEGGMGVGLHIRRTDADVTQNADPLPFPLLKGER